MRGCLMSIEALNWAFDLPLKKPTQKAVLIALANYADKQGGSCFPSIATIMRCTGLSERAVSPAIKWLEDNGLIVADRKPGRVTQYQLMFDADAPQEMQEAPAGDAVEPPQDVRVTPAGAADYPPITTKVTNTNQQFEDFWSLYPRKIGKRTAEKAFGRALKRATPKEIMGGLTCQVKVWRQTGADAKYIPHASTWLNRDGWLDELAPTVDGRSKMASPAGG